MRALGAQESVQGRELPPTTEIRAIFTGLREIAVEERVELIRDRICRLEVTHPDYPANLKASKCNGHLPNAVWIRTHAMPNADERVGKHRSSVFKASFAYAMLQSIMCGSRCGGLRGGARRNNNTE